MESKTTIDEILDLEEKIAKEKYPRSSYMNSLRRRLIQIKPLGKKPTQRNCIFNTKSYKLPSSDGEYSKYQMDTVYSLTLIENGYFLRDKDAPTPEIQFSYASLKHPANFYEIANELAWVFGGEDKLFWTHTQVKDLTMLYPELLIPRPDQILRHNYFLYKDEMNNRCAIEIVGCTQKNNKNDIRFFLRPIYLYSMSVKDEPKFFLPFPFKK